MKKYEIIVNTIKSKILNKEYNVGDILPSEQQLQSEHNVSRHTVRQALQILVNEGYVVKEQGSGTYVSDAYKNKNVNDTKTIGIITTYFSEYIFPSIIRGIEETLKANGYALLVASTNNDFEQEKQCLEMMLEQNVSALIVEPTKSNEFNPNLSYYSALKQRGVPVVMFNAFYELINFPYVKIDDQLAGYLVTEHLIENGHENIMAFVKSDDQQGKQRLAGYIRAHVDNKVDFLPQHSFTYTTENLDSVIKDAIEYIKVNNQVSAIACYNDDVASKIVRDLVVAGFSIPEDISIIGVDNAPISASGEVKLTTVTHPQEKMGKDLASMIISNLEKKTVLENIIYKPELIVRDSVKNING